MHERGEITLFIIQLVLKGSTRKLLRAEAKFSTRRLQEKWSNYAMLSKRLHVSFDDENLCPCRDNNLNFAEILPATLTLLANCAHFQSILKSYSFINLVGNGDQL